MLQEGIMKTRALKIYRIVLISLVNLILILGFIILYKAYYDRLPGSIILEIKKEQVLSYNLPVSGTIYFSDNAQEICSLSNISPKPVISACHCASNWSIDEPSPI